MTASAGDALWLDISAIRDQPQIQALRDGGAFRVTGRNRKGMMRTPTLMAARVWGDEQRFYCQANDSIVRSEHYDKSYTDLFALQDAITRAVADALKAERLTVPGAVVQSDRPPGGSVAAWSAFQRGEGYFDVGSESSTREAIAAYRKALQLDPRYAAAYAALSSVLLHQATVIGAVPRRRHCWRRAVQLTPHNAAAVTALGYVLASLGRNRKAASLQQRALVSDPCVAGAFNNLSVYFSALGETYSARKAIDTAIALRPAAADQYGQLATVEIRAGDPDAALTAARKETDPVWREIAPALALQIGPDRAAADAALLQLISDHAGNAAYQICRSVRAARRCQRHLQVAGPRIAEPRSWSLAAAQ